MFFRRRRCCSLLHVLLLLLGVKAVRSGCKASPEQKEAFRAKGRLFRSRLMDAFAVWTDEKAEKKEGTEAPAEQQG